MNGCPLSRPRVTYRNVRVWAYSYDGYRTSGECYADGAPRVHQIGAKSFALVFADPWVAYSRQPTANDVNIGRSA